jgi:hypothetical protein
MRASRIFVVIFVFFTLSNALYAGQSKEDEGKDTVSELDCDYTSATHSLWSDFDYSRHRLLSGYRSLTVLL